MDVLNSLIASYNPSTNAANNSNALLSQGLATNDPSFFQLYVEQIKSQSASLLFSSSDDNDDNNNSLFDNLSSLSSANNSLYGSGNGIGSSPLSQNSGTSLAMQMISQSGLIGKTVKANHPTNPNETISGVVKNVSVKDGQIKIGVGEFEIPPEYLIEINA
ncbi:MAG: hypothetical protein HQ564_10135 [Candidatus Saganbacteria bacterium]|nr:hypothetical protein [Candidatus Saganbacteria bacterium]